MPTRRWYDWEARTREDSPDPRYAIWRFALRDQPYTVTKPLGYKGDRHHRFSTIGFTSTYEQAVELVQQRSGGRRKDFSGCVTA